VEWRRSSLIVTLLHNSGAGDEDHSGDVLAAMIADAGHEVVYQSTDDEEWHEALARGSDLIAIAGGDGTLRKALTALAERESPPVTMLPLGSANNTARAFGFSAAHPGELVAGWAHGERRRFRLGEVETAGRSEVFIETVGGGLFAEAIKEAEPLEDVADNKVELGLQVLGRLLDERDTTSWRVTVDDHDASGDYLAVEAMVIGHTGPRIPLAPAADPEDRHLDVVLISDAHRASLKRYVDARLDDLDPVPPVLPVKRCLRADLNPIEDAFIRLDDELRPGTPSAYRARLAERTLEVLVPPSAPSP
jgi:diacylglycerol kinase family enzyme